MFTVPSQGEQEMVWDPVERSTSHSRDSKLQALVYDILPPTAALTDYVIGLDKLSTWCSNGSMLSVKDNSGYVKRSFYGR